MNTRRTDLPAFSGHHKLLFLPLKMFVDRLKRRDPTFKGGWWIFEDQRAFRTIVEATVEFGGDFEAGLLELPLRMANSRVGGWLNSQYGKF